VGSYSNDREEIEDQIPELAKADYDVTSDPLLDYNCFAWAARDSSSYWDPLQVGDGYFWPEGADAFPTLPAYVSAYATEGFRQCKSSDLEPGIEKIAIFVDRAGDPFHAARQLPNGRWTSKLGDKHDIEHDLADLDGATLMGRVAVILERACPGPPPVPPGHRTLILPDSLKD